MATTVLNKTSPSVPAVRQPRNLDEIIKWETAIDVGMLQDFVNNPPLRPVVIEFSPEAAQQFLQTANTDNRPLARSNRDALVRDIKADSFEMTGDTIKVSESGRLLDGQHRLDACLRAGRNLRSYVAFGIKEDVFDVLDQGRKRTPGDVLAYAGVKDSNIIAAGVRWAEAFRLKTSSKHLKLSVRDVRKLATGRHKALGHWVGHGRMINAGFKHSPSMITALLYTVAQSSKELAESFAQDWTAGPKFPNTRNNNFTVLAKRILEISTHGRVDPTTRAALVVMTFNAWNADVKLSPRDLTWRKSWKFPAIETDAKAYLSGASSRQSTSDLTDKQMLVFVAVEARVDRRDNRARVSIDQLCSDTDILPNALGSIVKQLVERGFLIAHQQAARTSEPWTFEVSREFKTDSE